MGEKGGSIRGSTSLSSDGSQPESCSGCLDPRDGSKSSIASHRLSPRAKTKPAIPAMPLIPTHLKQSLEYAEIPAQRIQKNSKPGSQNAASECPSCSILPRCKAAEPVNSGNTALQTGNRLRRSPNIIYIRTAEK